MFEDRWYSTILLVQSEIESVADYEPLVDHAVRLLKAPDAESAYLRALELGAGEETSYLNEDGELVTWRFIGLRDLCKLDEPPGDGTEVLSWLGHEAAQSVDKEQLTVFWWEREDDRTAGEILDG